MKLKSALVIMICLYSLTLLNGCETWKGFGRDVEDVGKEIQ